MPAPASQDSNLIEKILKHAWWILLLAALGIHGYATQQRIERVEQLTDLPTWSVDPAQRDSSSPTGFEMGQRKLIVPGHHNPSYLWTMEAQQTAHSGSWRLRHIDYDSHPEGRSIQRTSPYRWWLIANGWLYATLNGDDLGYSIERGSLWSDPIIFALILVCGSIYCARYLNAFSALGFTIAAVSIFPLAANFQPGAPDPHSLSWALAVGSLLPLLASYRSEKRPQKPYLHFAVAGLCAGLGFWNDAASQAPITLAIVAGAFAYEFFRSKNESSDTAHPNAWRVWGITIAVVALAACAFEFAPNHFQASLDSINPIHAAFCLGAGESLRLFAFYLRKDRIPFTPLNYSLLALSVVAILSWPATSVWTDTGSLLAGDFYARELANHPNGSLAPDLGTWFAREGDNGPKFVTLLPAALIIVALIRLLLGKLEPETKGQLAFALLASFFALVLAYFELRWWNLFNAFALVLIAALFSTANRATSLQTAKSLACLLLVLPGLFIGLPQAKAEDVSKNLTQLEKQALVGRDFSYWLNQRRGEKLPVAFSTPLFSNLLNYYGGIATIVSSDDGYESGYLTAVRMASADSEQEVSILLSSREITHVVLPLWDPILDHMVRVGMGVPAGEALPPGAFAVSLREWDFPAWLRPMGYSIPKGIGFEAFEIREFALQSEQESELLLSRLADHFVASDNLRDARAIRVGLKGYSRSPIALGAVANIDVALNDAADLEQTLETLIPYLSRRSARNLPTDRRISLAWLFARTKHSDLARDQLTAAFEKLDAETLRTMTPFSVTTLLVLSRNLEIPFPDETLHSIAKTLVAPNIRKQIAAD